MQEVFKSVEKKMNKSLDNQLSEYASIRAGRANAGVLDKITVDYYDGEILGITLPEKVEYEVIETEPAVRGNTTNNAQKDAKIETGYIVKVPLFINQGEKIIVSTKDGKYSSRA